MKIEEEWFGMSDLERHLLMLVARELGPALDRVEPDVLALKVRDLVVQMVGGEEGPSPAEIRSALIGLIDLGYLRHLQKGEDPDLLSSECRITLTIAGLLAAREIDSKIGRPKGRFELVLGRDPEPFGARFETGDQDLDRELNHRGAVLAAFYALAVLQPTSEYPCSLAELVDVAELLAVHGVRSRSGPSRRDDKLGITAETISDAVERLRPILPGLERLADPGDGRRHRWAMSPSWPNIIVRGGADGICTWRSLVLRLQDAKNQALQNRRHVLARQPETQRAQGPV